MELINRKHKGIAQRSRGKVMITFTKDKIYFTKAVVEEFKLKLGLFVHFLPYGRTWGFIYNTDPDGFPLVSDGGAKQGYVINSRGLVAMFAKQSGYTKFPCSFYIQKSQGTYQDKAIVEILSDKTIQEIID